MATELLILAESGLPWQVKRSALAGEVVRRQLNMDERSWEYERCQVIEKFNHKMLVSGYNSLEQTLSNPDKLIKINDLKSFDPQFGTKVFIDPSKRSML